MQPQFDLVIRNGTVITAADATRCDVGIKDGKIEALARVLGAGAEEIDATGRLVLPGGIDSHVHFEQDSPHDDMDYTPYEGHQVRGWPEITLSRGAVVCRDFEFLGKREHGAFLRCGISNPPRNDDALLKL